MDQIYSIFEHQITAYIWFYNKLKYQNFEPIIKILTFDDYFGGFYLIIFLWFLGLNTLKKKCVLSHGEIHIILIANLECGCNVLYSNKMLKSNYRYEVM